MQKLKTTNEQIAGLQVSLAVLIPKLGEENKNANEKALLIKENNTMASQKEIIVKEESAVVQVEALKIDDLRKSNEEELAKCRPALEEAERIANSLNKGSIDEIKSFVAPHDVVKLAMRCVFTYLGHNIKADYEWSQGKSLLSDIKFLEKLKNYEKNKITPATLQKVK